MSKLNWWRNIKYYSSYWYLFILAVVFCIAAAWLYIYTATPVYEASASLLIKSDNKDEDGKNLQTLTLFGSKKILENEIEVLRSYTVVSQAVKNLRLYAPVFKTNKFSFTSAYVLSPVAVELRDPDHLTEHNNEKIYFKYHPETKSVQIGNASYPLNAWVNFGRGDARFIENPAFSDNHREGNYFFSFVKVQKVADQLLVKLDLQTPNKLATIIDLKLPDEVPRRSADILNELMIVYQKVDVEDKVNVAENALKFLDERIDHEVGELNAIESALQQFKSTRGLVDISEQGRLFLGNVGKNDQDIGQINTQLDILQQLEDYIRQHDANGKLIPSMVGLTDPQLSQLVDRLYTKESEFSRIRGSVAENNPIFVSYKNEIESIRAAIRESIRGLRSNLMISKENLSHAGGKYVSSLRSIPEKEKQLLELNRQQSIKNEIYTFLLQKREEAVLANASSLSDSRIVDYAQTTILPVKPKRQIVYLAAVILGLGMVGLWLYVSNMMNPKVWSKDDIVETLGLPLVGEVPRLKAGKRTDLLNVKNESLSEEFRRIRAALAYEDPASPNKKVLITSLHEKEGKAFVAVHLARSLAALNKKTLIIDLNPCEQAFDSFAGAEGDRTGISAWLSGRKNEDELIVRSTEYPNISLMTLGNPESGDPELFAENKFAELFCRLQHRYDSILIISAPLCSSSDAYQLSQWSDTTILAVRKGYTPLHDLGDIHSSKNVLKLKNLAVILFQK